MMKLKPGTWLIRSTWTKRDGRTGSVHASSTRAQAHPWCVGWVCVALRPSTPDSTTMRWIRPHGPVHDWERSGGALSVSCFRSLDFGFVPSNRQPRWSWSRLPLLFRSPVHVRRRRLQGGSTLSLDHSEILTGTRLGPSRGTHPDGYPLA